MLHGYIKYSSVSGYEGGLWSPVRVGFPVLVCL